MKPNLTEYRGLVYYLLIMLSLIVFILIACMVSGCSREVYVPVETVSLRTDTIKEVQLRTDTVLDRDTVLTYINGDTVRLEKIKWRIRYSNRQDTLYVAKHDTVTKEIPVKVEKIVEVERKRQWWEIALLCIGAVAVIISGMIIWKRCK